MQKGYGRITYLEPLYQLQRLAVILVCFEDDICQFMYDHIQRALVFNGFGKVKLKKKTQEKTFINKWRMWGSLSKVLPSHRAFALHTAFILTCYPNPWQLTFHWLPGNLTQIFISQQCTPNSMKRQWNCCQAPFFQRSFCASSPPWGSISFFALLPAITCVCNAKRLSQQKLSPLIKGTPPLPFALWACTERHPGWSYR